MTHTHDGIDDLIAFTEAVASRDIPMEFTDSVVTPEILETLGMVRQMVRTIEDETDTLTHAIQRLRSKGVTWQAIADALGMTRQGAWEKYRSSV